MKQQPEILNSWKEISAYLGRGVRTAQRWERDFGLPVRRPAGHLKSSVVALRADIDHWVANRSQRDAASSQGDPQHADRDRLIKNLQELVRNLAALNAQQAELLKNQRLARRMLALRNGSTQDILLAAMEQGNLEHPGPDLSVAPAA